MEERKMKRKLLLLLPLLSMALVGCNRGGGTSSTSSKGGDTSSQPATSSSEEEQKDFLIYCYLDYNHYDKNNPYLRVWWDYNTPFTQADIGLINPTTAPDPYYPTFLGWSMNALVDEDKYLFKFGETVITEQMAVGGYINLFGIFVGGK